MNLLALDLATKTTGYSIFINEKLETYGKIEAKDGTFMERIFSIRNVIYPMIKEYKISEIVIEEVPMMATRNLIVAHDLCVFQGVILEICISENLGLTTYAPSAWRSVIGTYDGTQLRTKRDFQKEKAVEIVNKMFDLNFKYYKNNSIRRNEFSDDDICEAILIGVAHLKEKNLWGKSN